jgi:GDP-4-dehydro-6-deoxy-D-mannose reductase
LESIKNPCTILGVDINPPAFDQIKYSHIHCTFQKVDLLNRKQVDNILYNFQPDYILHLASYSSVAYSWKNPVSAFVNNSNIFLNLIDQVRVLNLPCRILSVGSSEEYGKILSGSLPLHEGLATHPTSPYAVARVTQEMLSQIYAEGYGIDVVLTRSFNHIGPGQKAIFAISSFAKKLVELQNNRGTQRKISVGNIEVIRDFVDVRDVVRAYYLLFQKGKKGEVYNICSGEGHSLRDILTKMMTILELEVEFEVDSQLIRPGENIIVIGSNKKIRNEVGWEPTIAIDESVTDIIDYWEKEIQ